MKDTSMAEQNRKKLTVLLANPPWHKKGFYGVRAGSRWPHFEEESCEYMPFPFFLAYATSLLKESGFSTILIDALAQKMTRLQFYNQIREHRPDVIALEVSSFSLDNDLEVAKELKNQYPKTSMILMGLSKEIQQENFLKRNSFIDYVIAGEYEETLLELVHNIRTNVPYKKIKGCIFLDTQGKFQSLEPRPLIEDIDRLPWPDRSQLPMHLYHDEPGNIPVPSVQMWGSRGCPFQCIFCGWPQIMYGCNQYRERNIIDMANEFEWLVTEWGFKSVYFDDDTFNVNQKRITAFCNELIRRGLNIPWAAMCRADLVSEPLIKAMKESGVHALKFGLESADQNAIDTMKKGLNLEKSVKNIHLVQNYGIKTHLTFMFGLPGETKESCQKTLDLALHLNPESLQMTLASPFPGSRFMEFLEKKGHLTKEISQADGFRTSCVRTDAMSSEELEDFVKYAHNQWLLHKARLKPRPGRGMRKRGLVSVIIPNYNGEAFIRAAVQSVLEQTYQPVEIIVIDNHSTDKSVEIVRRNFPSVKLVEFTDNYGFAFAANAGISIAEGDYIALLNPDAKADPQWLQNILPALESSPQIGFGASKVLCHHNPELIDSAGDAILTNGRAFNIAHHNRDTKEHNIRRWVFGATGAAVVYKRHVLKEAGNFDSDFFMYLEDVDLSMRLQLLGYKCVYEPTSVVYHIGSAVSETINGLKTYYITRNAFAVLLKNFPKKILKASIPFIFLHVLRMGLYHFFISRTPVSFLRGLFDGLRFARSCVPKRKRILGARRISDSEFLDILHFGKVAWKITRKHRQKPPSNRTIHISKAPPTNS
jgi:GT2 family glycosyltransferase/radical SAM superfamily enzyme YgiQ (UPF0313 family)